MTYDLYAFTEFLNARIAYVRCIGRERMHCKCVIMTMMTTTATNSFGKLLRREPSLVTLIVKDKAVCEPVIYLTSVSLR